MPSRSVSTSASGSSTTTTTTTTTTLQPLSLSHSKSTSLHSSSSTSSSTLPSSTLLSRRLSDPLSRALLPPVNEPPAEREKRLARELEAKKVSDDIDEAIRVERVEMRRRKQEIKILLLGQSESGKSTTLKQFQLLHTPNAFHAERIAWRSVIYLNLIRSVRRILEALAPASAPDPASSTSLPGDLYGLNTHAHGNGHGHNTTSSMALSPTSYEYPGPSSSAGASGSGWGGAGTGNANGNGNGYGYGTWKGKNKEKEKEKDSKEDRLATKFEQYRVKLAPLMILEERLIRQLSFPDEDGENQNGFGSGAFGGGGFGDGNGNGLGKGKTVNRSGGAGNNNGYALSPTSPTGPGREGFVIGFAHNTNTNTAGSSSSSSSSTAPHAYAYSGTLSPSPSLSTLSPHTSPHTHTHTTREPTIRPTSTWKKALSPLSHSLSASTKNAQTGEIRGWWEDPSDPVHVIGRCAVGEWGMLSLWKDVDVRNVLGRRRVRMEECSGFYLDDIPRITALRYIPNNDDVLKARLKTLGVVEHTFTIKGADKGVEWKIYDVGGARHQRQAWAPYFEDVNAIIFLAPISAFDQVLAEDITVNRLEDSLLLWKEVVQNKLLANINIILFLNKIDLLKAKLEAGVQLCHHMISYGDRPNDFDSVCKYFRNKFGALHQSFSPNKERELYIHLTSVTDTRKTSTIISNVRDIILRGNLKGSRLI